MYRDLPAEVWRAELGVEEASAPRALVVHGEWSAERFFAGARLRLAEPRLVLPYLALGRYRGVPVAVATVYGAAQAADVTFLVVRAGARFVVQIGYFGGLRTDQSADAVLAPDLVVPEEGIARRFQRRGPIRPAGGARVRAAIAELGEVSGGTLVSTGCISAETDRMVDRWVRRGLDGVDMESAATVAVAQTLGARAGVALQVFDNLIRGEGLYSELIRAEEARQRRDDRIDRLFELALEHAVAEVG